MGVSGLVPALRASEILSIKRKTLLLIKEDEEFHNKLKEHFEGNFPSLLAIDTPGLLHSAAAYILGYDSYANTKPASIGSEEQLGTMIAQRMVELIEAYCDRYCPEKVYISMDGVVPYAKMEQQRKRRYMHVAGSSSTFNSNILTPHTPLMNVVDSKLREFLETKYIAERIPRYIFDGQRNPGEGEHKIANYIRQNPQTCVFLSDDSDVLLIALLFGKKCLIKREVDREHIDANTFGALIKRLGVDVRSFIILISIIGNDFIPHHDIMLKQSGKNVIIEAIKLIKGKSLYPLNTETLVTLYKVLKSVADKEKELMLEYGADVPETGKVFYASRKSEDWYKLEISPFKKRIPKDIDIEKMAMMMCRRFIQGLYWTAEYYTGEFVISYQWSYGFTRAPLFSTLVRYVKNSPRELIKAVKSSYEKSGKELFCSSLVHRMCVIPITSWIGPFGALSPEEVAKVSEIEGSIWHMLPTSFKKISTDVAITSTNKYLFWSTGKKPERIEGYVIGGENVAIPPMNVSTILDALEEDLIPSRKPRLITPEKIERGKASKKVVLKRLLESYNVYYRNSPKQQQERAGHSDKHVTIAPIEPETKQSIKTVQSEKPNEEHPKPVKYTSAPVVKKPRMTIRDKHEAITKIITETPKDLLVKGTIPVIRE